MPGQVPPPPQRSDWPDSLASTCVVHADLREELTTVPAQRLASQLAIACLLGLDACQDRAGGDGRDGLYSRNVGDARWLPCKHIYIRPWERNERAFLLAV